MGKPEEVIAASLDLNERIFRVVRKGHDWPHTERTLRQTIADWRASLEGEVKIEFDRFTRKNPNHWKWLADQCAEPLQKLKDLNHLFQHCKTGLMREYAEIEETFAPEAMEVISAWIMKRVH